jgi:hypothetical protein
MKLVSNGTFSDLQQALAEELLKTIKRVLDDSGAPHELAEELTASIGFAVACLIDDTAGFEHNGVAVTPMLTFQTSDTELEYAGGNSWMHEYIYKLMPSIFPGPP